MQSKILIFSEENECLHCCNNAASAILAKQEHVCPSCHSTHATALAVGSLQRCVAVRAGAGAEDEFSTLCKGNAFQKNLYQDPECQWLFSCQAKAQTSGSKCYKYTTAPMTHAAASS